MERTKLMSKEVREHRGAQASLPISHVFVCSFPQKARFLKVKELRLKANSLLGQ